MRPSTTTLTSAGAMLAAVALLAATGAADAKSSCKPKKEQAGCVLKQAAYQTGDTRFSVILGKGEASAAGTVTCSGSDGSGGSPQNVLYGSYPQLAIKNPKIGKTYKRTLPIKADPSAGLHNEGQVVLTVELISAKRARVTYVQDYKSTLQSATSTSTATCHGQSTGLLKRVS
jgi:hypothetical protein